MFNKFIAEKLMNLLNSLLNDDEVLATIDNPEEIYHQY